MKQYVNLRRIVTASIKPVCTKGEVRFVTNRIISDLRNISAFDSYVTAFEVSPGPIQLPGDPEKQHHGKVILNKGVEIHYGITYN